MSRPAVSQHLRVLTGAGLVEVRAARNRRLYRWRREGLRDLTQFFEAMWSDSLTRLKAAVRPAKTRTGLDPGLLMSDPGLEAAHE